MSKWKEASEQEGKADLKAARQEAEMLREHLEAARHGRKREPIYVSPVTAPTGQFTRIVVPDTHGNKIARHAAAAFLADVKRINPREVVMLGDHLDCGGFLAQHHTLGFVAECDDTYEDDSKSTNDFLDLLQKSAPKARFHYLEGNHEHRVEAYCITMALRNKSNAQFLLNAIGPEAVLKLKERGITYYRTSGRYNGLPTPGTIKLGKCHFTHGFGHGRHATADHLSRAAACIVHGHTHRAQGYVNRTIGTGVIAGYCPGTLSQLQPMYAHTRPTDWSHGYGVQIVDKDGSFVHFNVPIINGKSLLRKGIL
jgi:predicted phosphodiesterase